MCERKKQYTSCWKVPKITPTDYLKHLLLKHVNPKKKKNDNVFCAVSITTFKRSSQREKERESGVNAFKSRHKYTGIIKSKASLSLSLSLSHLHTNLQKPSHSKPAFTKRERVRDRERASCISLSTERERERETICNLLVSFN